MLTPDLMQLIKDAASEVIVLCFVAYLMYKAVSRWIEKYYDTMPQIYMEGVNALKDLATSIRISTDELSRRMEMVTRSQTAMWNDLDNMIRQERGPDGKTGPRSPSA